MSSGIQDLGEVFHQDDVDDVNIPINVFISEEEDHRGRKTGYWTLIADCYQPRRARVDAEVYRLRARDPELLRRWVGEKVVPLYQTALSILEAMRDGKEEHLYHWTKR